MLWKIKLNTLRPWFCGYHCLRGRANCVREGSQTGWGKAPYKVIDFQRPARFSPRVFVSSTKIKIPVSSPHSNVNAINLKIIELLTKVINGNSWSFSKINSSLESTSSMLYPVWLWFISPLNDSLKKKNPNLSIYHQVHLCLWSQQDQHLAYTIAGNQEPILSYKEL